jgi:prevent-host-death family protein
MRTAGIREARQALSVLLEDVKGGREILITDRGRPVARLVPPLPPAAKPFTGRGDFRRAMPALRPPLPAAGNPRAWSATLAGPLYLDASALARLYVPGPGSDALDQALRGRRDLTLSDLAVTELLAALAAARSAHGTQSAARVRRQLLADLEAGLYRRAEVAPATHRAAERLLLAGRAPLPAADALHLALAMTAGVASFITYDPRRRKAARDLGLGAPP